MRFSQFFITAQNVRSFFAFTRGTHFENKVARAFVWKNNFSHALNWLSPLTKIQLSTHLFHLHPLIRSLFSLVPISLFLCLSVSLMRLVSCVKFYEYERFLSQKHSLNYDYNVGKCRWGIRVKWKIKQQHIAASVHRIQRSNHTYAVRYSIE